MAVFVTKANGSKQLFDREKVVQTCLRMGANSYIANQVAEKVERRLYEGISSRTILQIIFSLMRKQKPAVKHLFDLKRGISLMRPKPEFESFVQVLLSQSGYHVRPNQIVRGQCGEHEIDGVAIKEGVTYLVEIKHHSSYHALTGLDESRIARAILEDVTDGYALGTTGLKFDRAMIVTNTRYSEHAIQYGSCRNILQIGWASPGNFGLRDIVERHKLYPLSCLRSLGIEERQRLVEAGMVLIKQLLNQTVEDIERKTGLPQTVIISIIEKAQHTTETLWL